MIVLINKITNIVDIRNSTLVLMYLKYKNVTIIYSLFINKS